MTDNPEAPHKAVIGLTVEVHEVLSTGECSGRPVATQSLLLALDGDNKEECLQKLNDFLQRTRELCP